MSADGTYTVSGQGGRSYKVTRRGDMWSCNCPDFVHRQRECKHVRKVKATDKW